MKNLVESCWFYSSFRQILQNLIDFGEISNDIKYTSKSFKIHHFIKYKKSFEYHQILKDFLKSKTNTPRF